MAQRATERRSPSRPDRNPTTAETEAKLPVWADTVRAAPNEPFRTALFNIRNSNHPRRHLRDELLPSADRTIRITYTGEELRQTDELVWLQVLHLMRGKPLSGWAEFTAYRMIQSMRHTSSKPSRAHRERLLASLSRMQQGSLSVRIKRLDLEVRLPLISAIETEDTLSGKELPKWRVAIDPKMTLLFGQTSFTRLDWEQHLQLSTGLSSWLHGYFASHANPGQIKLSTLQRASGSNTVAPGKFAQMMRFALDELKDAKFLVYGDVQGELVHVLRNPKL